ncbi:lysozyme [Pseudacidovorax sp. 1753]|uniref:lysozyme n=1 Tax=Pseudacidovorax sp. 1753 TaxID=3156419 RepID=UPI00339A4C35
MTVPLSQCQRDATVSRVYNTGPGGKGRDGILWLADGRASTLLRKLNAGDFAGAADELPNWVRAGGQVLKGLQRRRHATRLVFLRRGCGRGDRGRRMRASRGLAARAGRDYTYGGRTRLGASRCVGLQ